MQFALAFLVWCVSHTLSSEFVSESYATPNGIKCSDDGIDSALTTGAVCWNYFPSKVASLKSTTTPPALAGSPCFSLWTRMTASFLPQLNLATGIITTRFMPYADNQLNTKFFFRSKAGSAHYFGVEITSEISTKNLRLKWSCNGAGGSEFDWIPGTHNDISPKNGTSLSQMEIGFLIGGNRTLGVLYDMYTGTMYVNDLDSMVPPYLWNETEWFISVGNSLPLPILGTEKTEFENKHFRLRVATGDVDPEYLADIQGLIPVMPLRSMMVTNFHHVVTAEAKSKLKPFKRTNGAMVGFHKDLNVPICSKEGYALDAFTAEAQMGSATRRGDFGDLSNDPLILSMEYRTNLPPPQPGWGHCQTPANTGLVTGQVVTGFSHFGHHPSKYLSVIAEFSPPLSPGLDIANLVARLNVPGWAEVKIVLGSGPQKGAEVKSLFTWLAANTNPGGPMPDAETHQSKKVISSIDTVAGQDSLKQHYGKSYSATGVLYEIGFKIVSQKQASGTADDLEHCLTVFVRRIPGHSMEPDAQMTKTSYCGTLGPFGLVGGDEAVIPGLYQGAQVDLTLHPGDDFPGTGPQSAIIHAVRFRDEDTDATEAMPELLVTEDPFGTGFVDVAELFSNTGGGGSSLKWGTFAAIGAGSAAGVLLVCVAVIVIGVVVVVVVVQRSAVRRAVLVAQASTATTSTSTTNSTESTTTKRGDLQTVQIAGRPESKGVRLDDLDVLLQKEQEHSVAQLQIDQSLFEVDYNDLLVERSIGTGGSNAVVFKAVWNGIDVAFKAFKLHDFLSQERFQEFEKEVKILASVSHPFILRFYGACLHPPRVGILMEYCSQGDLRQYLKDTNPDYPLSGRLLMMEQTASAMVFLHSRNILHRDLKPENVLLDSHMECKVMDFGLSRMMDSVSQTKTTRIGTSYYMAPEITLSQKYGPKVDVFSFAIMMVEVVSGQFNPFGMKTSEAGVSMAGIEMRIAMEPTFRPEVPEGVPKWAARLMKKCWAHEPEDRPVFEEVVKELKKGREKMGQKKEGSMKEEEDSSSSSSSSSED